MDSITTIDNLWRKFMLSAIFTPVLFFCTIFSSSAISAEEEVIFSDDFSSGNLANWDVEDNDLWNVSNGILRGEGGDWITTKDNFFDERFRATFRLRLIGDELHINLRNGTAARYFINFGINGTRLSKQYFPDTFLNDLVVDETDYASNTWYDIEIVHDADVLVMSVDGIEKIRYVDSDTLQSGNFGFELFDGVPIEIDDVEIYGQAVEAFAPWISTGGPQGGLGYDIRMRGDDSNSLLVTDANAGVFKSSNGGISWVASNEGIDTRTGATGDLIPVFCLSIDPNDPATIWVGTSGIRGIFRSIDGGNTWERRDSGIVESTGITFRGLAIAPGNSNVVYAAAEIDSSIWNGEPSQGREFDMTQGVVYKSVDAGNNWTEVWRGENLARYVLIDPENTDIVYVSTGIFDREAANSDPDTLTKTVPGGEGVIKSEDGGVSWQNVNSGLENLYVGSLSMDPTDSSRLLAGVGNNQYFTGGGVFYSDDGGENWSRGIGISDIITAVEFSDSDPNIAYAGSIAAIYRSSDRGQNWQRVGDEEWGPEGIRAGFPIDFQLDTNDSDKLYINNYAGGNFLSTDGGETWNTASQGYTGAQVRDVIVDSENSGHILAAARSGLFETPDGGADWIGRSNGDMKVLEWNAIDMSPDNNQMLVAGSNHVKQVSISDDGGLSWDIVGKVVADNQGWRVVTFASSTRLYAGSGGYFSAGTFTSSVDGSGVQRSSDGGLNWTWANSGLMSTAHVTSITTAADDVDLVIAATTNRGILRSVDGGENWQELTSGLPDMSALSVTINPQDSSIVLAGFEFGGLYRSTNGGDSWTQLTSGISPEGQITATVFDPTEVMTIYAADKSAGVFRTTDGGTRWNAINTSLGNRELNSIALSGDGLHLYGATEGGGVFRLDINEIEPPNYDIPDSNNGSGSDAGDDVDSITASFTAGVITIPLLVVGEDYYSLELALLDAESLTFSLAAAEILTAPGSNVQGASQFIGLVLSIPVLRVGEDSYQVGLELTSSEPIIFTIVSAEPL